MHFYRAIIFAPPHAQLLINHQKRMNVRAKHFPNILNQQLLLVQDKKAFGLIKITKIVPITSLHQFLSLYPLHKISEKERKDWWKKIPTKKHPFYGYIIQIIKKFPKPVQVDWIQGPRIFIKPDNITFKKLN